MKRINREELEYPDELRRTLVDRIKGNAGSFSLAAIMLLGGGGTETVNHFRMASLEKQAEEHSHVLGRISDRLGKIDQAVAVLQSQGTESAIQTRALNANIQDLTRAVYLLEGAGRNDKSRVTANP